MEQDTAQVNEILGHEWQLLSGAIALYPPSIN